MQTQRWTPWSAPLALVAGFAAALFGSLIVGIVGAAAGASVSQPPPSVQIVDTVVQDLALVAAAIAFARRFGRVSPQMFGLRRTALWGSVWRAAAAGIGFGVFLYAWSALLHLHDKERIVDQLGANRSSVAAVAVAILVCVIAPFCEEFAFRGYFFGALSNWRGPWVAAAITGLVFGAIHAGSAPAAYLVPLAFLGFLLCLLRWRTRSLYPGIALHCLNNALALGVSLSWGWQIPVVMTSSLALLAAGAAMLERVFASPATAH